MKDEQKEQVNSNSFINGLLVPLLGPKGVNRQIGIQQENCHKGSGLGAFAAGHLIMGSLILSGFSVWIYTL